MVSRKNKKRESASRMAPLRNRPQKKAPPRRAASRGPLNTAKWAAACFIAGWALTLLAFFTQPQFWFILPKGRPYFDLPYWPQLIAGFVLMVWGLSKIPAENTGSDLSAFKARLFFFPILVLTYVLRMNDADALPALARIDHWFIISAARQALDFGYHPLLIPPDDRTPFVTYALAAVWFFIPKMTGVFAIRFASTLMDLVMVWVMYLCGKEMGGRRLGIILMFMAAISKSFIEATKYDLGINSVFMACALFVLFLLRIFKKPSLKHFLQLGLVLGLSDYAYTPARPFIPSILLGLLVWIMLDKQKRPKSRLGWTLSLGLGTAWIIMFVCKNSAIPQKIPSVNYLTQGWGGLLLLAFFVAVFFRVWKTGTREKIVVGWAATALLTALIEIPLWLDPGYNWHPSEVAIWADQFHLTFWTALKQMASSFTQTFQYLFGNNGDLAPYPFLNRDCFMDYFISFFGLAGLASYLVKPSWPKLTILGLYLVGILPVILSPGMMWPHLLGCMVPLFLIAGAGVYRLWQALSQLGRWGWVAGTLFLLLTGGWFLYKNAQWVVFWESQHSPDLIGDEIITYDAPSCRIYLVPFPQSFVIVIPDHVSEGRDVHMAGPSNPIDLIPGEKGKDLAVVTWVGDKATQERIQKEFPNAVWHDKKSHHGYIEMRWAYIPFQDITESPDKLFYVRKDSPETWDRKFYSDFALARGTVLSEDRVVRWNDSIPVSLVGENYTGRLEGTWVVPNAGKYDLKLQTYNPTKVWVDGNIVLSLLPPISKPAEAELNLPAGNHAVEIATAFKSERSFPAVQVHSLGENWVKPMEELSGMAPVEPQQSK